MNSGSNMAQHPHTETSGGKSRQRAYVLKEIVSGDMGADKPLFIMPWLQWLTDLTLRNDMYCLCEEWN